MNPIETTTEGVSENIINIHEILDMLPHRYPFLLVDKITEVTADSVTGIKNVTINEPFFAGHFPFRPVMPGVLIIEALAQATGVLIFKMVGKKASEERLYYLVGVDNARFKKPVEPGDQLVLETKLIKAKRDIWKFSTQAKVDGSVVCSAEIMSVFKELSSDI